MTSTTDLPPKHRALIQAKYAEPPTVQEVSTPQPTPGSVIVRVLQASVLSYAKDIYNGVRKYPYPTPLTLGTGALGRVAVVGPDSTSLKPGQLVYCDPFIRSRDEPSQAILFGIHEGYTEGSKKLMAGEWRDATYAEYAKLPLENCHVLDESRLFDSSDKGGLGYDIGNLGALAKLTVPYGGLVDINLRPGETIAISPATGGFGGAAVVAALAMGAGRIIAMGRNVEALKRLSEKDPRIVTVQITGDVQEDLKALTKFGPIDAFFDISPPIAGKSPHIKSAVLALRLSGRVSLMGGQMEDVPIPHAKVMHYNLQLKGKWMYERDDLKRLIQMIQSGILKLKGWPVLDCVESFGLEEWKEAFDSAEKNFGKGFVVIRP